MAESNSVGMDLLAGFIEGAIERGVARALAAKASEAREALWERSDVAAYLKCSEVKLDQLVKAGTVPSMMVGGSRRFDPEIVRQWVREQHGGRP